MGNDGGSIPTRRELVKSASRVPTSAEAKATRLEQQEYAWSTCPLSHRPLAAPVVSDCGGKLYNKDAILEFLLPNPDGTGDAGKKDAEEYLAGRVGGLRDIVEVKFASDGEESGDVKEHNGNGRSSPKSGQKWVCPITTKALGPSNKAVYFVPCGHAFSETAVKEMGVGEKCLTCNESYSPENLVPILPTLPADIERLALRAKALKEQGLTHSLKKAPGASKKRKQKNVEATVATETSLPSIAAATDIAVAQVDANATMPPPPFKKGSIPPLTASTTTSKASTSIKNSATASLTAKVLEEERERTKRRKLGTNDNLKSLFSESPAGSKSKEGKSIDFMTRGYSIPAGAKR
ncbi:MAG: hypothetical protein M1827_005789 [Pycnora praestabilis]|nr:MAG: hypothetical protein M1827_005789 [Pycnora praestabilis]